MRLICHGARAVVGLIGSFRAGLFVLLFLPLDGRGEAPGADLFRERVQPILKEYCYDCHGDGAKKGDVAFDSLETDAALMDHELWLKVLKNVRAGLMPPPKKPQPLPQHREQLIHWIKYSAFQIDPENPDPGRVTVRRLNRVEYRNTIRDLLGVDFDTENEFPADDSGHGFDNIGDVLTLPPMLLEKYLAAAQSIVNRAGASAPLVPSGRQIPDRADARREYAREILGPFARKAHRRPLEAATLDRLVAVAESVYSQKGKTFEEGIQQAMVAVLASPNFLFREEGFDPAAESKHPLVDEYSLASRLSYFLWSSMPDNELLVLAGEGKLRAQLRAQTSRMLADPKSEAFTRNFVGQWLQTRDIEKVPIDPRQVLAREAPPGPQPEPEPPEVVKKRLRFRELRDKLEISDDQLTAAEKQEMQQIHDGLFGPSAARSYRPQRATTPQGPRVDFSRELRRAMRRETEMAFEHILRNDRSLLELIDSDYTFLNERLARHYGLTNLNVKGDEMTLVKLPPDSARGGVVTHGSVLAVTSNPTRTSPVKRGLFILENILGTPPPLPPPDIPPLEDAAKAVKDRKLTLRETLALHREQPLCSSCHNRMDPLGLALENFNALGMWREQERGQPIDPAGQLLTGESFANVTDLKKILATRHTTEFYRTVTEKMLTYALGRGLEYYDVEVVDALAARLEKSGGRASELLAGIVESAPFQKTRAPQDAEGKKRVANHQETTRNKL